MRVIHTSDWHLGRSFGPVSLRGDHEAFCEWFVDLSAEQDADLVVVAGDLYDRAIAPTESIELFRETVQRLRARGITVAAITGNHDGADRVAPYDDLLDAGGVYIRGGYQGVGRVATLAFDDGPLDLVLVPFLDPQAAPDGFGGPATVACADADLGERRRRRTHESVLADALDRARANLVSPRSVVVSHAFVVGGESSESERQLEVGGTGAVDRAVFDGFSYVALGHLHRPQAIGRETIRYSGTPLPYSFSEDHAKSVVVVDLDAAGNGTIEEIPVPIGRRVVTIRGELDELLRSDLRPDARACFVRAIVTNRETVLDAKARLEQIYPYVVEVRLEPAGRSSDSFAHDAAPIERLEPIEVTRRFWEELEGGAPDADTDELLLRSVAAAMEVTS
ncbi:MAG: hypothetical protein RI958_254 [Actinomycetota bacterium]